MVNGIVIAMNLSVPMDKAGRLVLPKEVRTRLHLVQGDVLIIELVADEIRLRPKRAASAGISRAGGRPVWDAPGSAATAEEIEQVLQRGRNERDARAGGV